MWQRLGCRLPFLRHCLPLPGVLFGGTPSVEVACEERFVLGGRLRIVLGIEGIRYLPILSSVSLTS